MVTPAATTAALDDLRRRGPDGEGVQRFVLGSGGVWQPKAGDGPSQGGLLHTRLAIRDLSPAGQQPMANEDGQVWIVYNGEVYGWEEERNQLRAAGHAFRGESDTEFILHGYEEWGAGVLERLRGMFTFAILDLRRQEWFVARDRFGKKPCYWTTHGGFAFASHLKALLALLPGHSRALDPEAVDAYLTHRYVPAPRSLFQGIQKLPPAHSLRMPLAGGEPVLQEYWRPTAGSGATAAEELRRSVALRLRSDRRVGLFLSGGVDSQAVARMVVASGMAEPQAFTAVFPEHPQFNEQAEAVAAAAALGLRHELLPVRLELGDLHRVVADLDEPLADPSCLPTWTLCRTAAQHITVALTGDGGDELFAGYKRYEQHLRARRWQGLTLPTPARFAGDAPILKATTTGRLRRLWLERRLRWEDAYVLRFSGLDPETRAFLQPDFPVAAPHYWRLPVEPRSPLEWLLECDRLNYLPEYVLRKGDLCGMAHGLELRAPLLDHVFWQMTLGLPARHRFTRPAKAWLREQSGITAPAAKRGFNPPLADWLKSPALSATLVTLPDTLADVTSGQVAAERVRSLLAHWRAGHASAEHIWQLWVLAEATRHLKATAAA